MLQFVLTPMYLPHFCTEMKINNSPFSHYISARSWPQLNTEIQHICR